MWDLTMWRDSYLSFWSRKVKLRGLWARNLGERRVISTRSHASSKDISSRRWLQKERKLTITLLTTTVVFFVCWIPYAVHVLTSDENIRPQIKKVFSYFLTFKAAATYWCAILFQIFVWFALTNSCLNFFIYGVLNPSFKRRYKNVLRCFIHCKKDSESSHSV